MKIESCSEVPIKIIFLMVINWFLLLESGKSLDYKIVMMENYIKLKCLVLGVNYGSMGRPKKEIQSTSAERMRKFRANAAKREQENKKQREKRMQKRK